MDCSLVVHLIRHGESAANAGQASDDPASIPLTELGLSQADYLASTLSFVPDRIIVSSYRRAKQTAAPVISRFPGVSADEWPIHEFTYLCPERCRGTTGTERLGWVKAYWDAADPDYVDGPEAESFSAFLVRVRWAVVELAALGQQGAEQVVLFGHGQFIQAMRWVMQEPGILASQEFMKAFRRLDRESPVGNCVGVIACFDGGQWAVT